MAKLSHTSENVIHVAILVLNLEKRLRVLLLDLLKCQKKPWHLAFSTEALNRSHLGLDML